MDQKPTRVRIVEAAHQLMLGVGLARTTTKEIAKAAGCSEAALYKYFANKEELFMAVLNERLPSLVSLLDRLRSESVGNPDRTVEQNLTDIAREAVLFYAQTFPMTASLYAEPRLKRRHYDTMREMGKGPHVPIEGLDAYLKAEQQAGRIDAQADTFAAASLLLGACAQRAFAYDTAPEGKPPHSVDDFAARITRTLLAGIA
ncbi:MAG: TetR/AcrR family transcriptional regulator [Catenulispora sp.]|nr:TetR/AcrR family transcriptional regulator [Catenulispora sp.]